jgi:hypothetical protein
MMETLTGEEEEDDMLARDANGREASRSRRGRWVFALARSKKVV